MNVSVHIVFSVCAIHAGKPSQNDVLIIRAMLDACRQYHADNSFVCHSDPGKRL